VFYKKAVLFIVFISLFQINIFGQKFENYKVPITAIFHDIGKNTLHSIIYNYGLYFLGAGAGAWTMIETSIDWQYNRITYNNPALAYAGFPSLYIGYAMPVVLPASLYLFGIGTLNERMQIAGFSAAQATLISIGLTSILKGATGRISPGIVDVLDHSRSADTVDYSRDFAWGFGKRGFIAGFPSAHTTIAFATAAVLSEIYHDSLLIKIASYSYAIFIGTGVSLSVHWASEVFAGALVGYAVGKTVGRNFIGLFEGKSKTTNLSLQITSNAIFIIYKI
jgi:membrane-associated phospholipid phosphatase